MAHLESSPEVAKGKQDWSCGHKQVVAGGKGLQGLMEEESFVLQVTPL